MYHLQKATQVTPAIADEAHTLRWLSELYAYPDIDDPTSALSKAGAGTNTYVRANMVSSVDGAAAFDGKSGGLGGDGDKTVFRVLRALCDVVVVGARTAVGEGYRQPSPDEILASDRAARGQLPAPALALVSNSLSIPPDFPPIASSDTVILTCVSAPKVTRAQLVDAGATLVDCGDESVDMGAALNACEQRGWMRVLTEGGPSILGAFIDADLLDELCVTTSPTVIAGDAARIAHHSGTPRLHALRPAQILTDDDGFVFTRWTRTH